MRNDGMFNVPGRGNTTVETAGWRLILTTSLQRQEAGSMESASCRVKFSAVS